jgi:hypothetical protein
MREHAQQRLADDHGRNVGGAVTRPAPFGHEHAEGRAIVTDAGRIGTGPGSRGAKERLLDRPVGHGDSGLRAPAGQDLDAAGGGKPGHVGREARLPDPGVAGDEESPAPARERAVQGGCQYLQLIAAADEYRTKHRPHLREAR